MTTRERFTDPFADPFASRTSRAPEWRPRGAGRIPGEIGIWVFIIGDMLIFGLFFIVFIVERASNVSLFEQAHASMSLTFGAVNTLLLLTGSMFVVLGLNAIRRGASRLGRRMILLTLLTGAGFVFNKYLEYSDKLTHGHTPLTNSFYMYYFVFTGIHLVHLLIGMAALAIMFRIAQRPALVAKDVRTIEAGACFWHLIDLLWIVLFALLYLVR